MSPHRKKPFSGKAKKQQLQAKKHNKLGVESSIGRRTTTLLKNESSDEEETDVLKINQQPSKSFGRSNRNRYNLQFRKDADSEILARKEESRKTLIQLKPEELEIDIDQYFPPGLRFPVRPPWDFHMTREQLNAKENMFYSEYLKELENKFGQENLSYFELNLETWRQLWRVLEMSDILLVIVDIRFPALLFPPSLYEYVTKELKKNIILVLNKIDLAPAPLTVAWKHYLKTKFPQMEIITFTSFPSYNLKGATMKASGLQVRKRKGRMRMAAEGAQKLYNACKTIVMDDVDISSWEKKIKEEMNREYDDDEEIEIGETVNLKRQETNYYQHKRYEGGVLTIGCIGQPNVGKSSLMNALMGKKVVSVSRTPGHTKHFQTIFLTPHVKLCDCPGLVFPSKVPKELQVLMGSYPIAQLRDPYSSVKYLAEKIDLVKLLKLEHPSKEEEWSAMDICDGWALKRKFYTARTARLDSYRAANNLLRIALDGKIALCLYPPNYLKNKEKWENYPEVQAVEWILAKGEGSQPSEISSDVSLEEDEFDEDDIACGTKSKMTSKSKETKEGSDVDTDSDDNKEEEESEEEVQTMNKFAALNC